MNIKYYVENEYEKDLKLAYLSAQFLTDGEQRGVKIYTKKNTQVTVGADGIKVLNLVCVRPLRSTNYKVEVKKISKVYKDKLGFFCRPFEFGKVYINSLIPDALIKSETEEQ